MLHIYDVSVVVCGDLLGLALYRQTTTNHHRNAVNNTKFGMMCICVPVKSMPRLFCVMYKVSGRYIDCKYYYLVFTAVQTL